MMLYLLKTEISESKTVFSGLLSVYGIGKHNASLICKLLGFTMSFRCQDLTKKQVGDIVRVVNSLDLLLNDELKKKKKDSSSRLLHIRAARGLRKEKGLPVRGQRTHTNAQTSKKFKSLAYDKKPTSPQKQSSGKAKLQNKKNKKAKAKK